MVFINEVGDIERYGTGRRFLTPQDIHHLAAFNSERARGIMHTPEWIEKMARLQARFNETNTMG